MWSLGSDLGLGKCRCKW